MKQQHLNILLIPIICFILSACTTNEDQTILAAPTIQSPYVDSTRHYLELADESQATDKQAYQLKAAGRAVQEGRSRQATQLLRQVRKSELTPELRQERHILEAQVDLLKKQPQKAIRQLSQIGDKESFSPYLRQQYHASLAKAYLANDNPIHSVEERIKLEHLLSDDKSLAANRRLIWRTLSRLAKSELNTQAMEASPDSELQGWLQFVSLSKQYQGVPSMMLRSLQTWQEQHYNHPANTLVTSDVQSTVHQLAPTPTQVALLLPLSGPLAKPGKAIRDGFMSNYYRAMKRQSHGTTVKFYDTNQGDIEDIVQQALNQGADFIVGPLAKNNVLSVAKQRLPVRVLSLNYASSSSPNPSFYQFGLSPLDEARQVAQKAWQDGHRRTLIIAPDDAWSRQMLQAYAKQWRSQGGIIAETMHYQSTQNMSQAIKDVLHINQSTQRDAQLKSLLGKKIKFIPRRRQDFDNIFLIAYPQKAREIRPLLKFYYAGNIPIYATSMIYNGTTSVSRDRDLDGIIFCDIPWVFQGGSQVQAKYNDRHGQWPAQLNSYARLYALGKDAFSLSYQLNQLLLFPQSSVEDLTGTLYLNSQGRLQRQLQWAQFKRGKPRPYT